MIEINLNNLEKNVRELTKDGRKLIGVVKNNAYGCGAIKISEHLEKCQVDYLLVNDISETKKLLDSGIKTNIIIFNGICDTCYPIISEYPNLVVSLNSLDDCLSLNKYCPTPVRVHIQIDTGLNRLGIKDMNEYKSLLNVIKNNDKFIVEGIYTHFASQELAPLQLEKFISYVGMHDYKMVHCASSGTYSTISYGNYVRCGLSLYDLNPVMSVKVKPIAIRKLSKGETLGYGFEYIASDDIIIAVLPVGYGNGYRLGFSGFNVYANGNYYQVIGRICMNHFFVKVDESINMDTEFALMNEYIPASKLASYLGTSVYDIYTNWKIDKVKYIE